MNIVKKVSVKLLGEAKEEYLALQELVRKEQEKGVSSSFHQTLLRSIESKIALLKQNYDSGIQIPRKLIPRKYLSEYGVTNLWKVNLAGYWRLIYTLNRPQTERAEVGVISVWLDVLDIMKHEDYDKTFGYKKK